MTPEEKAFHEKEARRDWMIRFGGQDGRKAPLFNTYFAGWLAAIEWKDDLSKTHRLGAGKETKG